MHHIPPFDPRRVRADLQRSLDPGLRRRRGIVGASLIGFASMTAVTLLQAGIVRHLPDPPIRGFESDRVNLGKTAFASGGPDGPVSAASLALNLPLATYGGGDRAERTPWLPLLASGKAAVDAAAAAWYFYQMPKKEKAWCAYCIVGALANAAVFALTLPEARRAVSAIRTGRRETGNPLVRRAEGGGIRGVLGGRRL